MGFWTFGIHKKCDIMLPCTPSPLSRSVTDLWPSPPSERDMTYFMDGPQEFLPGVGTPAEEHYL